MGRGLGRPAKTRGLSHGQGGLRHRTYYSSNSTPHFMGRGPSRPGKTRGPPHGLGRAAHIKPTSHGQRPGPAHQISSRWAAARLGPSNFHMMGRGPARPIKFSDDGPRPGLHHQISHDGPQPGPAHQIFRTLGPAQPGPPNFQNSRPGPARPIQILKTLGPVWPGPSHLQFFRPDLARPITFSKSRPGSARPALSAHDMPWKILPDDAFFMAASKRLPYRSYYLLRYKWGISPFDYLQKVDQ